MKLLGASSVEQMISTDSPRLAIKNFDAASLQHSSYYLRLGRRFRRRDPAGGFEADEIIENDVPFLRFDSLEYIHVTSHEEVSLDGTLLGFLGGTTDIARLGFQLTYGPVVDPLFPGDPGRTAPLEFGLLNMNRTVAALPLFSVVGKLVLFDVSDSEDLSIIPGSLSEKKFGEHFSGW